MARNARTWLTVSQVTNYSLRRGLPCELIVDRLSTSGKGGANVFLEFVQVALQNAPVEFDLDVAARAERTVVGLPDLLGQADVQFGIVTPK